MSSMERYTIREVADMFHMEPSTLRYYEDAGLLTNIGRTPAGITGIRSPVSAGTAAMPAAPR